MSDKAVLSRRTMLKAGALAAVPLVPAAAEASETLTARIALLEDEAAIRALLASSRLTLAAPTGTEMVAFGPGAEIRVAADRRSATAELTAAIERETMLDPSSTFAQMALLQGGGVNRVRTSHPVKVRLVRGPGGWSVEHAVLAAG